MDIINLPDLESEDLFTGEAIKCSSLQSSSVLRCKPSFVRKLTESYEIITYDIRGNMIKLTLTVEDLIKLKNLSSNIKVDNSLIEVVQYHRGQKQVNTLYEVLNDEGFYEVPTHGFSLHYPKLDKAISETQSNYIMMDEYTVFNNQEYIFFVSNYFDINDLKAIRIVNRASIFNALVSLQALYGFKDIELKSLSMQLPKDTSLHDNDLVTIGNSVVYRISNTIKVVQLDLFTLATSAGFLNNSSRVGELRAKLDLSGSSAEKINSTKVQVHSAFLDATGQDKVTSEVTLYLHCSLDKSTLAEITVLGRIESYRIVDGEATHRVLEYKDVSERNTRNSDIPLVEHILNDRPFTKSERRNLAITYSNIKPFKLSGLFKRS